MRTAIDVPLPVALTTEISPPSFRDIFGLAPGEVAASRVCAFDDMAFVRKWLGFTLQNSVSACNLLEMKLKM
ncbi:hypothetical protein PQR57_41505 [Paraburkholderia dipogonis]|uniref:Uncharacterized protein n=1 Tax=Paraburkholderia dipogonis TaxID=1211383 RepID=A0ABW9B6D8_9BURK